MTTRSTTKTYSRKRRRVLSDPTDSPSSPSPAIPVFSDNIPGAKKRKSKPRQRTAKSDVSSSVDEVSPEFSPERPAKRLKKLSSSTTTDIQASHSIPLQITLSSSSQAGMASFATELCHPSLPIKIDNNHQIPSNSQRSKTIASTLLPRITGLNLAQPASHPIPFKRTKSHIQKENALTYPQSLASPFRMAPQQSSSRAHLSGMKQTHSSKFVRRQSADVLHTHTSPSTSFRRRPSGSHALQRKSNRNQDWLIPPAARIPLSTEENSTPFDPDVDLDKSHSFFSPQGFSTPVPLRHLNQPGTPTAPAPPLPLEERELSERQEHDAVMNDITPVLGGVTIQPLVVTSDRHILTSLTAAQKSPSQIPQRIVHLPHDSIFSSFDVSVSAATIQTDFNHSDEKVKDARGDLYQALSSRVDVSPTSEGEKLHDMFSVLGLAGSFTASSQVLSDMDWQRKAKGGRIKILGLGWMICEWTWARRRGEESKVIMGYNKQTSRRLQGRLSPMENLKFMTRNEKQKGKKPFQTINPFSHLPFVNVYPSRKNVFKCIPTMNPLLLKMMGTMSFSSLRKDGTGIRCTLFSCDNS